jgi:hypothetical protein
MATDFTKQIFLKSGGKPSNSFCEQRTWYIVPEQACCCLIIESVSHGHNSQCNIVQRKWHELKRERGRERFVYIPMIHHSVTWGLEQKSAAPYLTYLAYLPRPEHGKECQLADTVEDRDEAMTFCGNAMILIFARSCSKLNKSYPPANDSYSTH